MNFLYLLDPILLVNPYLFIFDLYLPYPLIFSYDLPIYSLYFHNPYFFLDPSDCFFKSLDISFNYNFIIFQEDKSYVPRWAIIYYFDSSVIFFFSKTQGLSLIFLFIYFLILIISISNKIKLYQEFLVFFDKLRNFKLRPIISFHLNNFFWNLIYLMVYWIRKKTWMRLSYRLLELKNKNKNLKYYEFQYIKFFYMKFMFDLFFSICLRVLYFLLIFLFRWVIYLLYSFLKFFLLKSDIYFIYLHISFYLNLIWRTIISLDLLSKIYSLINYLKTEIFTYYFNDHSFLGGLIYYLYNTLNHKIGTFYNSNNWENVEFKSSNFMIKCYNKFKPLIIYYNFNSWLFYRAFNLIYIFFFFFIFIICVILKIFTSIFKFLDNLIFYYNFIELKISLYLNRRIFLLFFITLFSSIYLDYSSTLLLLLLFFIIFYLDSLITICLVFQDKLNIFFYYLGFVSIYSLDFIKNIIYYFFFSLINIFFRLKYVILFLVLFKLGLFNILYIFFINWISNYFEYPLFFILDKVLYAIVDSYIIDSSYLLGPEFNSQLVKMVSHDYSEINHIMTVYVRNSFLNRIATLNFKSIDYSALTWTSFRKYQTNLIRQISARIYYRDLFLQYLWEFTTFIDICKNYYFLRFFKFYYIYLLKYSDLNLYYYLFKKVYTILYLLYIYLYFYLKWLYYYFVPLYIIPKGLMFKCFMIYTTFYLFFVKIYFVFSSILLLYLKYFILTVLRLIYISTFLKAYIFNWICLIYSILYDSFYLFFSLKLLVNYYDSLLDWYWDYFINKTLFMENLKDLLMNYLRIYKNNIIDFSLNKSLILGSKLKGVSYLDIESLNMAKVKAENITVDQMREFIVPSHAETKYNRIFKYRDNLLVYSDILVLFNIYYPSEYWEEFYVQEQWMFNFFLNKLIMYYLIDFYFLCYLFFYLCFYYIFKDKNEFLNLDHMWKSLKDEFDYKLLNDNKLFLKALDYYHEKTGKRKLNNRLFDQLNESWKKIQNKFFKKIKKFSKVKKNLYLFKRYLEVAQLKSFALKNSKLRNVYIEKYLYYNNKYFFYWKNFIFFDKQENFHVKYERNDNFLYFFLSLIFKKNKYSSKIFYYYDTFNKMYFYNNNLPGYLDKINDIFRNYFEKIDHSLYNNRGDSWLLHKDLSLILYKDESQDNSEMYSLNFNIIIPFYERIFFWVVMLAYLYFIKFHWRITPLLDIPGRVNRFIYVQSLIINNNFLFAYNLSIHWINAFAFVDLKHFSYEYNDRVTEFYEFRQLARFFYKSPSFPVYADPLFFHKKNAAYHILWLDLKYYFSYTSYNIYLFYSIKKVFLLVLLFWFYIKVVITNKSYKWLSVNENLDLITYLWYFYSKNILNLNNYLNFYYKKILSNLEMNKLFRKK